MDLDWIDVEGSKRIIAMAYDSEADLIHVRFPNGVEWRYELCPQHVWDEFSSPAQSKGKYIADVLNHKPHGRHT